MNSGIHDKMATFSVCIEGCYVNYSILANS